MLFPIPRRSRAFPFMILASLSLACSTTDSSTEGNSQQGLWIGSKTQLREEPGTAGKELDLAISKGQEVDFLQETSEDSAYVKIRVGQIEGWIPREGLLMNAKGAVMRYVTPLEEEDGSATGELVKELEYIAVLKYEGGRAFVTTTMPGETPRTGWLNPNVFSQSEETVRYALTNEASIARGSLPRPLPSEFEVAQPAAPTGDFTFRVVLDGTNAQDHQSLLTAYGFSVYNAESSIVALRPDAQTAVGKLINAMLFGENTQSFGTVADVHAGYAYNIVNYFNDDGPPVAASLLWRMFDRREQNMLDIWWSGKDLIFAAVSPELYKSKHLDLYVNLLLLSYAELSQRPFFEHEFAGILEKVDRYDAENRDSFVRTEEQLPFYRPIMSQRIATALEPYLNEYSNDLWTEWFASFWLRRFREGNVGATFAILGYIKEHYEPGSTANMQFTAPQDPWLPPPGETRTLKGTFSEAVFGDCPHLIFSCGDFGEADFQNLDAESQNLWKALHLDSDEGWSSNPEYVGKVFEITFTSITGTRCYGADVFEEGEVPKLLTVSVGQ